MIIAVEDIFFGRDPIKRLVDFFLDRLLCPDHPIGVNVSYNPETGDRKEFFVLRQK